MNLKTNSPCLDLITTLLCFYDAHVILEDVNNFNLQINMEINCLLSYPIGTLLWFYEAYVILKNVNNCNLLTALNTDDKEKII